MKKSTKIISLILMIICIFSLLVVSSSAFYQNSSGTPYVTPISVHIPRESSDITYSTSTDGSPYPYATASSVATYTPVENGSWVGDTSVYKYRLMLTDGAEISISLPPLVLPNYYEEKFLQTFSFYNFSDTANITNIIVGYGDCDVYDGGYYEVRLEDDLNVTGFNLYQLISNSSAEGVITSIRFTVEGAGYDMATLASSSFYVDIPSISEDIYNRIFYWHASNFIYDSGFSSGFETGENAGYTEGLYAGYEDGYDDGCGDGYDRGYGEGSKDGWYLGHDEGYADGKIAGFDEGYLKCLGEYEDGEENSNAVLNFFQGIYETIHNTLNIFFELEVFGFKLGNIIAILLGAAVVIVILKFLI